MMVAEFVARQQSGSPVNGETPNQNHTTSNMPGSHGNTNTNLRLSSTSPALSLNGNTNGGGSAGNTPNSVMNGNHNGQLNGNSFMHDSHGSLILSQGPMSPRSPLSDPYQNSYDLAAQLKRKELFTQRKQREFIPDNKKDDSYWDRRRRNNEAAKRSREKRRYNDMVLEQRVVELTKENHVLKAQLEAIKDKFNICGENLVNVERIMATLPTSEQVLSITKRAKLSNTVPPTIIYPQSPSPVSTSVIHQNVGLESPSSSPQQHQLRDPQQTVQHREQPVHLGHTNPQLSVHQQQQQQQSMVQHQQQQQQTSPQLHHLTANAAVLAVNSHHHSHHHYRSRQSSPHQSEPTYRETESYPASNARLQHNHQITQHHQGGRTSNSSANSNGPTNGNAGHHHLPQHNHHQHQHHLAHHHHHHHPHLPFTAAAAATVASVAAVSNSSPGQTTPPAVQLTATAASAAAVALASNICYGANGNVSIISPPAQLTDLSYDHSNCNGNVLNLSRRATSPYELSSGTASGAASGDDEQCENQPAIDLNNSLPLKLRHKSHLGDKDAATALLALQHIKQEPNSRSSPIWDGEGSSDERDSGISIGTTEWTLQRKIIVPTSDKEENIHLKSQLARLESEVANIKNMMILNTTTTPGATAAAQ
uniref:Putative basic region leucine zipper transcription factor n=1 Tax=Tabanus bromius TaxID=304241 RepID=A0A0K8TRR0_TABBR